MATNQDHISTDNEASIALLRRLRAGGGDDIHFVHRIDVCTAPPEVLVADLEPVPGTGLDDDGHGRIWYLYHAKKYKNSRGDTSGHRQRSVTGGGGATWHKENCKNVEGSGGGTVCSLSYGIKTDPSAPLDRMGWCMAEYDFVSGDNKHDGAAAAAASNYVLCKVYRSPRAKGKSASSSSNKKQTAKKRKAGRGEHPEVPPAKSIQQQEPQVQQDTTACYYPMPCYPEPEQGRLQQPIAELPETAVQRQLGAESSEHQEFTVEWLLRGGPPQPIVRPPPGHGCEFIQMPGGLVVPVVAEATVDDMLVGFAPETMYGQWSSGMTRASIPWSSYAPPTLYTGCNDSLMTC